MFYPQQIPPGTAAIKTREKSTDLLCPQKKPRCFCTTSCGLRFWRTTRNFRCPRPSCPCATCCLQTPATTHGRWWGCLGLTCPHQAVGTFPPCRAHPTRSKALFLISDSHPTFVCLSFSCLTLYNSSEPLVVSPEQGPSSSIGIIQKMLDNCTTLSLSGEWFTSSHQRR